MESENGDAWSCKFSFARHYLICRVPLTPIRAIDFSHEHARSRTYRWGEDGIAGVSDTHTLQNVAFAFWNEKEYVPCIVDSDHWLIYTIAIS